MRSIDVNNKIREIENLQESYNSFKEHSSRLIDKLKIEFDKQKLSFKANEDSTLEIKLWGIDLIIRTEIIFDFNSDFFRNGELNTYIEKDNIKSLILTYDFDSFGNISNRFLIENFASNYYVDIFENVISFSKGKNMKFILN